MADEESRTARFADWLRGTAPFIIVGLLVVLISAIVTLSGFASGVWDYYQDTFRWREQEYAKIRQLRGGMSIEKVEEILGSHLLTRQSADGALFEKSFRGRDYWVQAVHDEVGIVKMIGITSCDLDFEPKIDGPFGSVVLNESAFDAFDTEKPNLLRYFLSGATANTFFFDEYYGGNPGFYKTYFLGINDACPAVANYAVELAVREGIFLDEEIGSLPGPTGDPRPAAIKAQFDAANQHVVNFRSRSIINTYAETEVAPRADDVWIDSLINAFQIGVDRIQTRTIDQPRAP